MKNIQPSLFGLSKTKQKMIRHLHLLEMLQINICLAKDW